jgi:23S rRNA pseudouridine1911/1915/1917 synthase
VDTRELIVEEADAGERLDRFLATHLPDLSRTRLQALIRSGHVRLAGEVVRPSCRIEAGQCITVTIPPPEPTTLEPEAIPLDVLFEDEHLLAVNKAPGLVVHPAPGHASGTLVHAVLAHCTDLSGLGGEQRPGILHRLDKKTSGVILVAKHDRAHLELARQFKDRTVRKVYQALVHGACAEREFSCAANLGRHPRQRKMMAALDQGGREASTAFRVRNFLGELTAVEALPHTGRTHQVRVHLATCGYPVVNDDLYGRPLSVLRSSAVRALVRRYPGFLLHAWRLTFRHPVTGLEMELEAPLPAVFGDIIQMLAQV